ncbi:MAG: polyprenyl synthetase family protein [bacterium]|nr:polyprenyl synthetase family protein [bacterium]
MSRKSTEELQRYLLDGRSAIDDALDRALPSLGSTPPALHEAMRYTLLSPGKRLRGIVVLATCDLARGSREVALGPACAVEMVHAASLILDDLPCMDDATLRRGQTVLHKVSGEANAILAAVALLNAAFERIATTPGLRDRARRELTQQLAAAIGADGLIGGQLVDLESTGRRLDLERLEYIHSHKTGALFTAAAELGMLVGGARPREVEALRRYAKNLGLAFQITDDLLDYSGDPETTGKDAGLDRDKTTFVDLCGIDGARRLVDDLIDAAATALQPFGRKGRILASLAEFVRGRDR